MKNRLSNNLNIVKKMTTIIFIVFAFLFISGNNVSAAKSTPPPKDTQVFLDKSNNYCGSNPKIYTTLNLGCKKKGNPILDLLFAVIRFLVVGATLVITASIVVAGLQYISAESNPEKITKAKKRILSSLTALFMLIFGYAILNYLIPITVLK